MPRWTQGSTWAGLGRGLVPQEDGSSVQDRFQLFQWVPAATQRTVPETTARGPSGSYRPSQTHVNTYLPFSSSGPGEPRLPWESCWVWGQSVFTDSIQHEVRDLRMITPESGVSTMGWTGIHALFTSLFV